MSLVAFCLYLVKLSSDITYKKGFHEESNIRTDQSKIDDFFLHTLYISSFNFTRPFWSPSFEPPSRQAPGMGNHFSTKPDINVSSYVPTRRVYWTTMLFHPLS